MRRLVMVVATLALLAGCGSDSERSAGTAPDDSVVLGTDPVPTPTATARAKPRPKPKPEPKPEPEPATSAPRPATPAARKPGRVTVIGDSLAVGTRTLLPAALPGWSVQTDARKGRPLAEGVQVMGAAAVPAGSVLVLSLFTNDSPTATGALQSALRTAAEKVGPDGCQVWATIARPASGGEPANDILRRLDGGEVAGTRVVIADWAELVSRQPSMLAPDRVHGTPAGYRARAQLYADAVRRCAT